VAYNKLRELGEREPKIEYNYSDLYAEQLGITVECGRANLWSLWQFLHYPKEDKEFWLIPYPNEQEHQKIIRFFRTDNTKQFVTKKDHEMSARIAKTLE